MKEICRFPLTWYNRVNAQSALVVVFLCLNADVVALSCLTSSVLIRVG